MLASQPNNKWTTFKMTHKIHFSPPARASSRLRNESLSPKAGVFDRTCNGCHFENAEEFLFCSCLSWVITRAPLRRHARILSHTCHSPAFLSFLFRYTEKMTRRLPKMSTTVVKMRKHPKVVVTHGGRLRTVSLGSGAELFRWDPFMTIVFSRWTFQTESNSTFGDSP